ncbi:DUF3426 domain-containing protein [Luteimonas sp. MJ293]|uniref:DUF3426 domain-containing protein n=1 Tax=Luteimonas sp. MJ146 TaxID=3129240 RepID=UPI0031BA961C
MFINCPNCGALVATNLATDLPPERCPSCRFGLRAQPDSTAAEAGIAAAPAATTPAPVAGRPAPAAFVPLRPSRPSEVAEEQPSTPVEVVAAEPETPDTNDNQDTPKTPDSLDAPVQPESADPIPVAELPASDPVLPVAAPDVRSAPRFALTRRGNKTAPSWRLIAVAGGLVLLLVIQLLLAERTRLANHAAWRPVVTALCTVLRCQLPVWREPAAITVQQRDVRPVDGRAGVLQVSATINNESRRAQAWPRITLTLSDIDGRALGMRTFEPAEYLLQPPANITLASGEAAAIGLEIVEPSPHAVAFNFSFH